ncbi:MAG TPA: CHRD domain-containing protein [Albitalea sp.]|uniref:CHRD domain-containing protein n=1 Tax=Piscinibacter sp. TaxID=1903157 RepID=UPI002ED1295D
MQRPFLRGTLFAAAALVAGSVQAHDDDRAKARLSGFQEVLPLASNASGKFEARLSAGAISYELSYKDLEANATQSHIHFGQKGVNGGIIVFLCSNLGNGPAGTPACPATAGTVTGTLTAASVIGPAGQDIAPGQFDELLRALRSGTTYANVHSTKFPGGEIRGQIKVDD